MPSNYSLTHESKVMRDPVHGYIHVHYQVIWDLINAKEFQRLRRIHQLGGTYQVYHTAEHSRFSHSLGVYEVVRLMIETIEGLKDALSEFEQVALLCAGLLHDVGHGPYSHAFESVTEVNHESMTSRIILEDTQINQILRKHDANLPEFVNSIIDHSADRILLTQIISSQLDADRMDYLLRDSYFTGVSYGEFDLHRILRTLKLSQDRLVMKESGIHAVEDYIMARYQMYWQVYLHPTSRSFEVILQALFKRMRECMDEDESLLDYVAFFKPFLKGGDISLQAHYELDESACNYGFMTLTKSKDPILKDLSSRLLNRNLFEYLDFDSHQTIDQVEKQVSQAGYDPKYYCITDFMSQVLYTPYEESNGIGMEVLTRSGQVLELSKASDIVRGFVEGNHKEDRKIFFPREIDYEH